MWRILLNGCMGIVLQCIQNMLKRFMDITERKIIKLEECEHKRISQECPKAGISRLQILAKEIGAKFKVIKNHKHAKNPNILYFLPSSSDIAWSGIGRFANPIDGGYIFWNWTCTLIIWHFGVDELQMNATRKWLQNPHHFGDCWICHHEVNLCQDIKCPKCSRVTCTRCFFKHRVLNPNQFRLSETRGPQTTLKCYEKCSQCGTRFHVDLLNCYYQITDDLDQFGVQQRECIQSMRDNDETFAWMKRLFGRMQKLKVGDLVMLHGLKKEEWNGQVAIVTGRLIQRDGVRRWPIQMKDESNDKAAIKESNLRKVRDPRTKPPIWDW